jgi:hypothetical protein
MVRVRSRGARFAAALLALVWALTPNVASGDEEGVSAADSDHYLTPWTPCKHCKLLIGVGATYDLWDWTDGLVLPLTLELSDSRWELGAFRMARAQLVVSSRPHDGLAAEPYWGFSVMRRWQILHRSWGRLYFGFGGSYKTETDYLDGTRWNFAYLLGIRFDLGDHGSLLEITTRHWSNAWIKQPNRGQNFLTVSVSF